MVDLRNHEFDALVEEFRALRAELTTRIEKQQDITNFAIALLVGFVAVVKAVEGRASTEDALLQLRVFFPWISIVLSSFTLMTLDHEMNIAHLSIYVHTRLRPQVDAALQSTGLWEWNAYRAAWQQHVGAFTALTSSMASAKYAITIFPNMLLTAAYWYKRSPSSVSFLSWDWVAYAVSVMVLVWVLLTAGYTSRAYLFMKYKRHADLGKAISR